MTLQNQDGCASETHSKLFVVGHDSHPLKVRASPQVYNSNKQCDRYNQDKRAQKPFKLNKPIEEKK